MRGINNPSGETGAGKSIIIGSINLALGGKVQRRCQESRRTGNAEPALVNSCSV